MLLAIDGTFLIQILNFIVFSVLLNYLFIRPTQRAIERRRSLVAGLYREGDEFTRSAATLKAQADAILHEARRQTDEAQRAAAASASDEVHAIENKAESEAAATVQLAHATVANEHRLALEKQQAFVTELARSMVARATGTEHAL
jgi:F-type H+-transporting ATPase subunit b